MQRRAATSSLTSKADSWPLQEMSVLFPVNPCSYWCTSEGNIDMNAMTLMPWFGCQLQVGTEANKMLALFRDDLLNDGPSRGSMTG